eukprot:RCo024362
MTSMRFTWNPYSAEGILYIELSTGPSHAAAAAAAAPPAPPPPISTVPVEISVPKPDLLMPERTTVLQVRKHVPTAPAFVPGVMLPSTYLRSPRQPAMEAVERGSLYPRPLGPAFMPFPGVVLPVVISYASTKADAAQPAGVNLAETQVASKPFLRMEPWPCPHALEWKRLRWKKGMNSYLCLECGARWKGSGYFLQFMARDNGGPWSPTNALEGSALLDGRALKPPRHDPATSSTGPF